jgi:membrane protease YdiL (CAAX protease family)
MLGVFLLSWGSGVIQVTGVTAPDSTWWRWLLFIVVAAGLEELLNRSFLLRGLLVLLGRREWVAVAISAAFFGIAHLGNPSATAVSVVSNSLGGVMYAVAFLGSGSIWMPWALHFSWNFFQGQIFGFPVSGLVIPGLVQQTSTGAEWITGGAFGPEAGAFGILSRFTVLAALFAWFKWRYPEKGWKEVFLLR